MVKIIPGSLLTKLVLLYSISIAEMHFRNHTHKQSHQAPAGLEQHTKSQWIA